MEGVYASGATSGGVVSNFGALFVNQGGSASGTTVDATGSAYVFSGGTAISVTMSGGTMQVSGGTTFSTTVSSGGSEFVYSGGVASAATVSSGGTEDVSSGGKTSGAMVLSSGTETVLSGGSAFSTTLSGGTENVSSGGTATGGKVTSGGELLVSSAGSATGVTVSSAGLTAVFSGGTASDTTIAAGGKLQMLAGGSATGFVTFAGSGGLFAVGGTVMPTATISGFVSGDTIDLTGLTWSAGGTVSLSSSTAGELLVNEGGGTYDLQLDPDHSYAGETFSATQDFATGAGTGSDITVTCFAPGTLIATPGGAVAVETLRAGDLVLTADGARMPVRWLGVQTVATRFADPLLMLPIRIRAGALGENLPGRDLLLSPGHAVLLEDLLVQAGALVNGTSIVRETDVPERLRYYHVELDSHALLLAEGVAAESFLDGVEAMQFDNAHTRTACEIPAELPYPRIKSHRQVPRALRERLSRATPPVGGPLAA
jgi:autotransporter passenger strand-loop-strand repeat protein